MLSVREIIHRFDRKTILHGVSFDVKQGEIVCLLGPSGCGKTTLLRAIAGLETPAGGDVLVDGESVRDVPVHQRKFGLMFQDFALFPHMTVQQNVAFGLKMSNVSDLVRQQRASELLDLVGLTGYENRDVNSLSGGERQRVALARSLAPSPRLLMLDEPLGSLDAALRDRLVVELRQIIKKVKLTAMYVTHDQHEAYAIADRIVIMNAGEIEQVGTPQSVYRHPTSPFVARFLGLHNIIPVVEYDDARVWTPVGTFDIAGSPTSLLLHPDGLYLVDDDREDSISAEVIERTFQGRTYRLRVTHESGFELLLQMSMQQKNIPHVGSSIFVQIDPAWIVPFFDEN